MTHPDRWLVAMAMIGGTAGCAATLILWVIMTLPLALAEAIAGLR